MVASIEHRYAHRCAMLNKGSKRKGAQYSNYPVHTCASRIVWLHVRVLTAHILASLMRLTMKTLKITSCYIILRTAPAERVGQGEVGGVIHRVTCTRWLLGLAVKCHGWDHVGQLLPWLHGQALKTLLSSCRGFISGREGCLGPERVYANREC